MLPSNTKSDATTETATADRLRPIAEYARRLGIHPATICRWVQSGVKLPDGQRLRLRAIRAGSKWLVAESDWASFLDVQTAARLPDSSASTIRSPAQRRRASEAAARELERLGI